MAFLPSLSTFLRYSSTLFISGFFLTAGLLYTYQCALIYPSSFPAGSRTEVATPDEYDLPFEHVELRTVDGETLKAYFIPHESGKERPTVLFLHANAGNMGHRLPLASVFYKRFACNIFMLSYRGYGLSSGVPNEKGIRIDAQTALDWLKADERTKETRIVAYGQSIGGAVAVDLASRNGGAIHSLILENTFLSIPEMIPHVLPPVKPFTFLCREFWPTGTSIRRLPRSMPVLFLSGRQDELVPPGHMDVLYSRCGSTRKVWKAIEGGGHNDTCVKPGYFESIASFLALYVIAVPSADENDNVLETLRERERESRTPRLRRSASASSAESRGSRGSRSSRSGMERGARDGEGLRERARREEREMRGREEEEWERL